MSASRHVQDLDLLILPPVAGPRREPTFDELLHGWDDAPAASITPVAAPRPARGGWLRAPRATRAARPTHAATTRGVR